jgi:hypothetical protein
MTDRELLKLAAKAAGYNMAKVLDGYPMYMEGYGIWNPLTDDGDALRLAVRLRSYGVIISFVSVAQVEVLALRCDSPYEEFESTDPFAAARRAIVRAAAEIGRQMK